MKPSTGKFFSAVTLSVLFLLFHSLTKYWEKIKSFTVVLLTYTSCKVKKDLGHQEFLYNWCPFQAKGWISSEYFRATRNYIQINFFFMLMPCRVKWKWFIGSWWYLTVKSITLLSPNYRNDNERIDVSFNCWSISKILQMFCQGLQWIGSVGASCNKRQGTLEFRNASQ